MYHPEAVDALRADVRGRFHRSNNIAPAQEPATTEG